MDFDDLRNQIHQHAAMLMCSGKPRTRALMDSCRLACAVYDDDLFRNYLFHAADFIGVAPQLANLPSAEDIKGGSVAALTNIDDIKA